MKNLNETLAGMIDIHPVLISTTSNNNNSTVFSNPLHYYWNTLSQSTTNGLQTAYDWYYSGLFAHQKPENALLADIACHVFLSMAVFWSGALLYTFVDLTHWPAFIYRYKSRSSKYPVNNFLKHFLKVFKKYFFCTKCFPRSPANCSSKWPPWC